MWRLWLITCACGRIAFDPLGDGGTTGTADGPTITANVVFVTSTKTPISSLGGPAGANAICNTRATAAGFPATQYVAWLSSPTSNAIDALAGSRGWVRPDGLPVVDTPADLAAGRLLYSPTLDDATMPVLAEIATGTMADGTAHPTDTCNGFTGTAGMYQSGLPAAGILDWTQSSLALPCTDSIQFYCFGIGRNEAVMPAAIPSRRAFVSSLLFSPGGGLQAADMHCADAATAGGLVGEFRALLPTSTASAMSRFDLDGLPWARRDGVLVAPTAAAFATGNWLAPLVLDERGNNAARELAVVGAPSLTVASTTLTCSDWTNSATGMTSGGQANVAYGGGIAGYPLFCAGGGQLYCLEP